MRVPVINTVTGHINLLLYKEDSHEKKILNLAPQPLKSNVFISKKERKKNYFHHTHFT